MEFQQAQNYLLSLGNEIQAMKLGLETIGKLLAALGNPQRNYLKVQVAGTNGKGSVCAFLDSICERASLKVGTFTSPHLVSITERIRIGGVDISEEEFARLATLVREASESLVASGELETVPTFFEQVTAIALHAFAEAHVELAILETGLGGRLDATTAVNAEIAAITRIDIDHQKYLGETLEEIAAEKAAIIRADSIVSIGRQHPDAMRVIKNRCEKMNVVPRTLENAEWVHYASGYDFTFDEFSVDEIEISLPGEHQVENAALAILVVYELRRFFPISTEQIRAGIKGARHPGRLELIKLPHVDVILDGAHNPGGAEALAAYLRVNDLEAVSIVLLFAAMEDKDVVAMLGKLAPVVDDLVLTEATNPRAMPPEKIKDGVPDQIDPSRVSVVPDIAEGLEFALQRAWARKGIVVVTGSLYLVGEVKRLLGTSNLRFQI